MKSVHKFVLSRHGLNDMELPASAQLLRVGLQGPEIVVWAKCETKNPVVNRRILAVFTGEDIPIGGDGEYISTLQIQQPVKEGFREIVVHFFDLGEGPKIFVGH